MSLPREWNFQNSRGTLHWFDGSPRKDTKQEDLYDFVTDPVIKQSIESFQIPDFEMPIASIPTIKSLLAECNVGSLVSIQSAPPTSIEQKSLLEPVAVHESPPKRPVSMVLEPEIPLVRTDALQYPPTAPSEADEEDNENLLTVSSVTARPLIAKSREIVKKKKRKRECMQRYQDVCPDGGYGWVIVFGAFSVLFWVTGLVKSYGIFYIEIMETYPNSSASLASWIPAILSSLCLALAPVSSALCERFSCRIVVFIGGLFCATGLISCYFATSLIHLLFTFGILTGIGGGLSTTPGIILVSRYFDKRRALANGICISGTAAGSFVFPILIEHLVGLYGFHGTILILGGCMLHVCVSAMLYRPLNMECMPFKSNSELNLSTSRTDSFEDSSYRKTLDSLFSTDLMNEKIPEEEPKKTGSPDDSDEDKDVVDYSVLLRPMPSIRSSGILHSVEDLSTDSTCYFRSRPSITSSHRGSSRRRREPIPPVPPIQISNDEIIIKIPALEVPKDPQDSLQLAANRGLSKSMVIATPGVDPNLFIREENRKSQRSCCGKIKKYIDITLLKDFHFILMCSSVTLMSTGVPYMLYYLPAYVISAGYEKKEAGYLVAISAILDLIGRLGFGYLSDLQLFDRKKAYVSFIFGAGVSAMLIPSVNSWYLIGCAAGCYGLFLGCWYLLIPVLLADMFGTEKISSSYGLVRLFQSITAITVPPLAGYLRDSSGGYEIVFYTMGVCMVLGSLPLLVVIFQERRTEDCEQEQKESVKTLQ